MQRQWITTLTISSDSPADGDASSAANLAGLVDEALRQLGERVEGRVSLAVVPDSPATDVVLALEPPVPVHVVVPREAVPRGGDDARGRNVHRLEGAGRLASLNVQPGRGTSEEDWDDCHTWLASVADISIVIGAGKADDARADGTEKPPEIRIDPAAETLELTGFPEGSPLRDEAFAKVISDLSRGGEPPEELAELKKWASDVASKSAPRTRFFETSSLFLNISPSLILALGGAAMWTKSTIATWKFGAAFCAMLAALGLKRIHTRRRWLSARATAEICRSVGASGEILDPLFPPTARHLPEYGALARSIAINHTAKLKQVDEGVAAKCERYVTTRIDGQIKYYGDSADKTRAKRRWIRSVFRLSTFLALASTLCALLYLLDLLPWIPKAVNDRWISGFATFAFPAIAAASIGYLGLSESTRRADYYSELGGLLKQRRGIMLKLRSESSISEAVRETESILLEEVAAWLRRRLF